MLCKALSIYVNPDFSKYFESYITPVYDTVNNTTVLNVKDMFMLKYVPSDMPELNNEIIYLTDANAMQYNLGYFMLKYYTSVLQQLKTEGHCYMLMYPFSYCQSVEAVLSNTAGETVNTIELGGDMLLLVKLTSSRDLLLRIYKKIFNYTHNYISYEKSVSITHKDLKDLDMPGNDINYLCKSEDEILNAETTERILALNSVNDYLLIKVADDLYYFVSHYVILFSVRINKFSLGDCDGELYGMSGDVALATIVDCTQSYQIDYQEKIVYYKIILNGILKEHPNLFLVTDDTEDCGYDATYCFKTIEPALVRVSGNKLNSICKIERKDVKY